MKLEDLSQWKENIQSRNKSVQLDALAEIVHQINNLNMKCKKDYVKLINSDINYFLSEILIYQHKASTSLVIKIICHLSEAQEFFKNDFFRFIRSSLRLINSFSSDCVSDNCLEEAHYKRDILVFNTIILKRAQTFNVNFKDDRIPKVSFMITAASLTNLDSKIIGKLEFVNVVLDIFRLLQTSINDKIYQEKKLIDILKNLKFSKKDLLNVDYFMLVAKLFNTVINFLPATNEADNEILVKLITDKFIILVRFVVDESCELSRSCYEIFLNLFYYIFSSFVFIHVHHMLLNYFLTLNGLNFLIFIANNQERSRSGKLFEFKTRVVISEVLLHLSKIILEEDDDDVEKLSQLRQKYLKIILKSRINLQDLDIEECDELSRESMLFIIFKYYVLLKWNKMRACKGKMMCMMAFIIENFRENKMVMDRSIASMLFYIYTTNYVNIKIKNNMIVENSSTILMKFVESVNIIVDFDFFKWWFIHNHKNRARYEKLLTFLLSPKSTVEFTNLHVKDLFPIDIKFLMNIFINKKTPVENLEKAARLLCSMSLNLIDIRRIQSFYERQNNDKNRRRAIYALKILCANQNNLNFNRQLKTCEITSKILRESTNMDERLLAVHLLVKLTKIVIKKKRK